MSEFKKEVRYVVLKLSKMTDHQKTALGAVLSDIRLDAEAMPECVVVESDWPNYQETWDSIQAVCEGRFVARCTDREAAGALTSEDEPTPVQSETATNALHQSKPAARTAKKECMQKEKKIILRDSPEAASIQTVTGWVSSTGRFYGDNEDVARYDGATHTKCSKNPDHPIYAINSYCESCWDEKQQAVYEAMPAEPYNDGACMVFDTDQYFWEENEILDYCVDRGINPAELQLVHCVPTYASQIDGKDYFSDDLPEDGELPQVLQDAFDALNEIIGHKKHVLSWHQGKTKAVLSEAFIKRWENSCPDVGGYDDAL